MEKYLQFQPQYQTPQNTLTQIMRKVASVALGVPAGYYVTSQVTRETLYIYYASTPIFILIDSNDTTNSTTNFPQTSRPKLYIMQSPSNNYFKDININNLSLLKPQLQLPAGEQPAGSGNVDYVPMPDGFNYVVYTIPYDYCVFIVATLNTLAYVIQDGCDNTYQYADPQYNQFLYDQFNI